MPPGNKVLGLLVFELEKNPERLQIGYAVKSVVVFVQLLGVGVLDSRQAYFNSVGRALKLGKCPPEIFKSAHQHVWVAFDQQI